MKILPLSLLGLLALFHFQVSAAPLSVVRASAPGNNGTTSHAISGDGQFVAFASNSSNLVLNDNNTFTDIFVYNVATQAIERISLDTAGNEATSARGDGNSANPSISADGRYIAFSSRADNLVPGDTNAPIDAADGEDIFIVDRQAALNTPNRIRRVSVRPGGTETNRPSGYPSISGDGKYVAFESQDSGLVAGTSGANLFIYIVDTTQIGTVPGITGVPVPLSPSPANKECLNAAISADGKFVAFEFYVDSTLPLFKYSDIYSFDRVAATLKVITGQATTGAEGTARDGRFSQAPAISADGRYVAFNSNTLFTSGGSLSAFQNVFAADRTALPVTFRLASADSAGTVGPAGATFSAISGDGRFVTFCSAATNFLGGGTNSNGDVYRKDLTTNVLALAEITEGDNHSFDTAISADGKRVSFLSFATNLVAGDTDLNGSTDVFLAAFPSHVADLQSLTTTAGPIAPVFDKDTQVYTANVPNATATITITPTVLDPTATVEVNFVTVLSGNASGPISLNVGANPIDTVVTAQDGTTKPYTIIVTRASAANNNADLQDLTTTAGAITPTFASNVLAYTASVPNATSSITVTPTVLGAGATVKVNTTLVTSGVPSFLIPMFVGPNVIDIEVTAADGVTKKTYTLTVTKAGAGASNADLASLTTTAGSLTPAFASGTIDYTASVADDTMMITVTPTTVEPTATVKVNGVTVASGTASAPQMLMISPQNPINVEVTAPDGVNKKTYTILVARGRHGSNNADLASLTLTVNGTPVTFNKPFDPAVVTYTAGVPNGTTTANLTATVAESHATLKFNGTAATSGVAVPITPLAFEANPVRIAVKPEDANTHAKIYTLWILILKPGQPTPPTGNFVFGPASTLPGGGQAMIDTNGNYVGFVSVKLDPTASTPNCPAFRTDTATDEAGKIAAMALVDTFTRTPAARARAKAAAAGLVAAAAPLDNLVHITGAVKTVNGIPTVTAKSTTKNSTFEGTPFVGTGKVVVPASFTGVQGGSEIQGVMASGSVKVDGVTSKSKPAPVTWPIDPLNTSNIRGDWNFSLTISEKTDAKGKKFIAASALLYLPGGDTTRFKEKKVTFSAKNGYSISFSGGAKLDAAGAPIVDSKGKPVIDKKSKVSISKMLLTLNGTTNLWQPTAGVLKCQFLGQKQTFPLVDQLLNK